MRPRDSFKKGPAQFPVPEQTLPAVDAAFEQIVCEADMTKKAKTGTREWAEDNVNIQRGCKYGCLYCYARANALRFKRIASPADWSTPVINHKAVDKNYGKYPGVVMFPSTHDITPDNISECLCVLLKLLDAGNQVLIVSKPRIDCILLICHRLADYKEQIEFRFTIGSTHDDVLAFWEPGAPNFKMRLDCLKYAHFNRYRTSVSAEPYLDAGVEHLYLALFPYITESFWIGILREFKRRVDQDVMSAGQIHDYVEPLQACQTASAVWRLYEKLNGRPLIKWKDSIREIAGK